MRRGAVRTGRRFGRRGAGPALMVLALVGATVLGGPAVAEEDDTVDVEVAIEAQITYPETGAIPDTLVSSGFPPQVVCVVQPAFCPEELEPVRDIVGGITGGVGDNEETLPAVYTEPGTLLVSVLGGNPNYAAAFRIELPEIPSGERFEDLTLQIPQGDMTFDMDSPAFRRIMLGVIQTAGSQDPAVFAEQLQKAVQDEDLVASPELGIEACPLTVDVPEDAAPPQAAPVTEVYEETADGDMDVGVNCLFGANGVFDEDAGTWSFDITGAARAWADGTIANKGLYLRPIGVENLAFGDPDTSTNSQVQLRTDSMTAQVASAQPPAPPAGLPMPPPPPPPPAPQQEQARTLQQPSMSLPPAGSDTAEEPAPAAEVAPGEPEPEPIAMPELATAPGSDPPLLVLVPLFIAGMWLTIKSLTAELATSTATGGALTRLVNGRDAL
jgi:hypothetical protein